MDSRLIKFSYNQNKCAFFFNIQCWKQFLASKRTHFLSRFWFERHCKHDINHKLLRVSLASLVPLVETVYLVLVDSPVFLVLKATLERMA